MVTKKIRTVLLVFILCCTYQSILTNSYLSLGITYFSTGYELAVLPITWPWITYFAAGNGLEKVPPQQQVAAYLLGVAGFLGGCSLWYGTASALFRFKKGLFTKNKKDPEIQKPEILAPSSEKNKEDKKENSYKESPKWPYMSNYNHSS